MWIGTQDGVVVKVLSLNKEFKVPFPEGLRVSNISSDKHGNIWISGQNKLFVCRLIDKEKGVFELSDNLLEKTSEVQVINDFTLYKENQILLGTNKGLLQLTFKDFKKFENIKISKTTRFTNIEEIVTCTKQIGNTLWIGTRKGIYKTSINDNKLYILRNFNKDSYLVKNNYNNLYIKYIYEDIVGNIWFGTQKSGLFKYMPNLEKIDVFENKIGDKGGLSSKIVNTLYEDDYGVLWIGTGQGGLNKLNVLQKNFYSYQNHPFKKQSLSGNLTTAILEDNNGYLWVSTYNNTLCRSTTKINEATVSNIKFQDLRGRFPIGKNDIIRSIYQDSKFT
ncbi:ligand-binding sensor domain-containing protein [Wenyingzhuangia aestuarii]|uniref:ligand-binding sensor domain-containing protein n=1 Tax=Wenyingzhuangia aestuarii TaxID=1647582 RepID=UPI00143AB21C|nr:two-component regulator propeller domain-containing protein [Wenyingzhuangia aestuarii]NJB83492.1 ligand-binding sensor domain-containing protein [Wenyingzhuangia aestuarii]